VSDSLRTSRRNIQLTNFICLWMALSLCVILVFRWSIGAGSSWFFSPLLLEAALFVSILGINFLRLVDLSRILVCWTPALILVIDFKILITHTTPETSHYVGFRIFQIAFSFFPFLIFNISERFKFFIAVSVPVVFTLFFDNIINFLGVGYAAMNLHEESYGFTNFRTLISLALISAAFVFLKQLLEKQETENAMLIEQLAEKNQVIQRTAERELKRAYDRLSFHFNNTPLAVVERDRDFKITFWNKRAEELLGWTNHEVLGLKPQEFMIYHEDLARAIQTMNDTLNDKLDSSFMELRAITKQGKILNCLLYYSFLRDENGELETVLSFISDITEQRKANYFLNERVKELRTLYNASQMLTTSGKSMEEVFTSFPELLPSGWQFPDDCAAQLFIFDKAYPTKNFVSTPHAQRCDIIVNKKIVGLLEVVYLEEKPADFEGPFFKEERELLNAIAQMLQVYIERKLEEQALEKARANMHATINNTEIMIWSVDANFKLLSFNAPFEQYNNKRLKLPTFSGMDHRDYFDAHRAETWNNRYRKALAGEAYTFEETLGNTDLRFSLSPIVEKDRIIGVSVFADDVTARNEQSRNLAEANKKIAELRLMALRSVMNPHFIFNVLSSIQFFITKNDKLNALNYLTSFSKLMRTVLTRSVAETVSVKEEVDMLKEYIHLEKLRFDQLFEFKLECNAEIDLASYNIPPLLIQPYVENAILHGLYNKGASGVLILRIKILPDYLVFEIEDDGIGRAMATKIKEQSQITQKSMGTQLTEERLRLFNDDQENAVKYEDLVDENGNPAGTIVCVKIRTFTQ
jgi:PAS domain S-box-containing protein